ncbi:MAG: AsmA-like C-terminal region-containing protein [Janthinobacterium lividum]
MKSFPIWRVLGIGLLLLLLALGLAGWLLSSRYGQRYVQQQVRARLTQNSDLVLAPFEVEFSIWHDFPHFTASLSHLALTDTAHQQPLQVLQVGRADLRLELRELLHGRVQVSRLSLHDVDIEQRVDSLGRRWGLRSKQRPAQSKAPDINLSLDSVLVDNFRIASHNDYIHSAIEAEVRQGHLAASLRGGVLQVQGRLLAQLVQLRNRSGTLLSHEPVQAQVNYRYHFAQREGEFFNTWATLHRDTIRISGTHAADTVTGPSRGNLLALRFDGQQPLLEVLHAVMPPVARPFLQGVTSPSKAHITYLISGLSGPLVRPRTVLEFGLRGARIQWPDSARRIDRWDLQGTYDNGPLHLPQTMSVSLSQCRLYSPVGELDLTLLLRDFRRPFVHGHLRGRTQLRELAALLSPAGRWHARQGTADVDLYLRGLLPAVGRWRGEYHKNMSVRGTATLHQAAFDLGGRNGVSQLNVRLGLNDSLWLLSNASGLLHGMRFTATATTLHLYDYFTGQYPTTTIQGAVGVDALDIGRLRQLLRPAPKPTQAVAANGRRPRTVAQRQRMATTLGSSLVPAGMLLDVALRCGRLALATDTLRDLAVRVRHDGHRVQLTGIQGRLMGGRVSGQAQWPTDSANRVVPVSYAFGFKFDTLSYRYLLGRLTRPPQRSAKSPGSPAIRELLLAANGKLSYEIQKLQLPDGDALHNLNLRFDKQGNQLSVPYVHFTDPQGGIGTGSAAVQLNGLHIVTAAANLDLHYASLDVPRLLRMLATAAPPRPDSAGRAARDARRAARRQGAEAAQRPRSEFTAKLQITADKVHYAAIDGTQFRVVSRLQAGEAQLEDCTMNTLGGHITLRGRLLTNAGRQHHPLQAQLLLEDIQLPTLFGTLQGMRLNVLTDDNIRGTLRCAAALRTDLDARFSPDLDQTVAYLRADLRKLELVDVEALTAAFRFLRKRTSHLYFEPVSGDFIFNRGELLIPGLHLNSNLTELEISGRYDLTGRSDLFVGLNPLHAFFGNNQKRIGRIQAGEPMTRRDTKLTYVGLSRDQPRTKYRVKLFQGKEHAQAQAEVRRQARQLIITQRLDTTLRLLPLDLLNSSNRSITVP